MQKNAYLHYFKKESSKTKQTQQSIDESWTPSDRNANNLSGICIAGTEQADTIESQQGNLSYCPQRNDSPKNFNFHNLNLKSHPIKNFRVHNHSSQMFKRKKQTECNEHSPSKIDKSLRKNFSQINHNAIISQEINDVKYMTQTLNNPNPKNPNQISFQRVKTLQSPNILEQEKFFTQPIKPYDRNKTARNKKFRTLKTAFGDLNSSCRNYNDEYTMSLQNLRMGWRIVNTRSMIQEYRNSTYFTYHLYNGNMINKQKNTEAAQKQKKKINLKQMKNVYKVFFNENIMFKSKENKNPKIFQSIKKKDEVHEYILSQSQTKPKSQSGSYQASGQQQLSSTFDYIGQMEKQPIKRPRGSNKLKPCFFRSTYNQKDRILSKRICEQQKCQKISKSLYIKRSNFAEKTDLGIKPTRISMEEDDFQMNEVFGKGNIIIELRDLQIETFSTMKKDDLLVLQLMAKNGNVNLKSGIMSTPMKYREIKNGIKFAIDSKVGDFVPLKIWKYHGINLIQLGIIDLNLIVFKNRKKYFDVEDNIKSEPWSDGIQDIQLFRQQRQANTNKNRKQERDILFYHTREKLRKNKKVQIQVTVSMNCLIYSKKFAWQKTNITDQSEKQNLFVEDPNEEDELQ